ncbi:hypothetical protein [Pseudomonas sp. AS2.8]|uniref:hypothetical protein n=1 Tax=Pseudomonas sp. AS2.8 TaxID=2587128 RepID=UPI0016125DBB|nr:hypothetical protein [Pseudomonas sp. AS2.8]MBB2895271.1 hypothetical protein [Pseudomonas sp. AS2.8]
MDRHTTSLFHLKTPLSKVNFIKIKSSVRVMLNTQGAYVDQIYEDKVKLLGIALAIMVAGLTALFIGVMLELSETTYQVCSKP